MTIRTAAAIGFLTMVVGFIVVMIAAFVFPAEVNGLTITGYFLLASGALVYIFRSE